MSDSDAFEHWPVALVVQGLRQDLPDPVAVEEPLEIRVAPDAGRDPQPLSVTLRTPGHDRELVAGWLYTEGLIESREDLAEIIEGGPDEATRNRVSVRLRAGLTLPEEMARSFVSNAACGVCGKSSVDSIFVKGFPSLRHGAPVVAGSFLTALPARMRHAQAGFSATGGLHAAALFDPGGTLGLLREDVGRHNAVDKVVGARLLAGALPLRDEVMLVSGRAGFEIAQKAARAGVAILAAVGAPSSLSLRLAARSGMTVVGFLRDERFNVYTHPERIALEAPA